MSENNLELEHSNPWPHLIAPWAALLLAMVSKILILPALILDGCQIWVHEFGHAFIGWFGSRAATPLGIGWTNMELERSWFVYACFLFLIGITAWRSIQHRYYYLVFLALLALIGQTHFTFFSNDWRWARMVSYGGIGGEFWLSALLIMSFHYRLPSSIRWDWLRYFVLLVGVYTFYHAITFWHGVESGTQMFPWGSLIHGEEDGNGDMNRLVHEYGWTKEYIIAKYLQDGRVLLIILALHYLFHAARYLPNVKKQRP